MAALDPRLARDAKTFAVLAFRNGPLEDVHAGKTCPHCSGDPDYSHITEPQMKQMMQAAVNVVYRLLWQREHDPDTYARQQAFSDRYTRHWDDPQPKT